MMVQGWGQEEGSGRTGAHVDLVLVLRHFYRQRQTKHTPSSCLFCFVCQHTVLFCLPARHGFCFPLTHTLAGRFAVL